MKALILAIGLLVCPLAFAASSDVIAVRSRGGGQFVVHGVSQDFGASFATASVPGIHPIRLDPALVAISCDRIKQALLRELDCPDRWRGKIHIYIQSTRAHEAPPEVQSAFFSDAWQGRIWVPNEIESTKLVRVIVQALLLELANRVPGQYTSEIPLWLSEGITQVLLEKFGPGLVVEGQTRLIRLEMRTDPLVGVRARLNQGAVLSFNDLSFPDPAQLAADRWQRFEDCACLMVNELTRLPYGRGMLLNFLSGLPRHLNWQNAFFAAFGEHFPRPLDVEKWWALTVASVAGGGLGQTWPLDKSLEKLAGVLSVPVQVRHASDLLPVPANISLQKFIEQWDFAVQQPFLQQKIDQLRVLRLNASPVIAPLVEAYGSVLDVYLQKRQHNVRGPMAKGSGFERPQILIQDTVEKLDELDQKRLNGRPGSGSIAVAQPPP